MKKGVPNVISRRTLLQAAAAMAAYPTAAVWSQTRGIKVNDIHSQLNPTWVKKIARVESLSAVRRLIKESKKRANQISICGGRHAAGSQQFRTDGILIDTALLNKPLSFNRESGLLEVEAGIQWGQLLQYLDAQQLGADPQWNIAQKQTGAEELSIGGTIGCNAHGQGLRLPPFVSNIESLRILDASGELINCSRTENAELFRLANGGYGLFGMVYSATLRLVPRKKLKRNVEMTRVDQVVPTLEKCLKNDEILYGDFQFDIDEKSEGYLRDGVFTCYQLTDPQSPIRPQQKHLAAGAWMDFVLQAHIDKASTFHRYAQFYLASAGQVDWADGWHASVYLPNYHRVIDKKLKSKHHATEVLTEIYVPRDKFTVFIDKVRQDFLKNDINLIYSTVRFIEKDIDSFLPWAKNTFVCVIFNLHTVHTEEGIQKSADAFRRLIDNAIECGGSYYLTYHKFASSTQVKTCYPQFSEFLKLKLKYDPAERFCSDWYRHYRDIV